MVLLCISKKNQLIDRFFNNNLRISNLEIKIIKNIIQHINKAFDHRVRLGIMSVLMVSDSEEFTRLKELLGITDGNLASHIKHLEKEGYIMTIKQYIKNKPNTSYAISKAGRLAFTAHIEALEKLLKT